MNIRRGTPTPPEPLRRTEPETPPGTTTPWRRREFLKAGALTAATLAASLDLATPPDRGPRIPTRPLAEEDLESRPDRAG